MSGPNGPGKPSRAQPQPRSLITPLPQKDTTMNYIPNALFILFAWSISAGAILRFLDKN
jgi:hypothetical protein